MQAARLAGKDVNPVLFYSTLLYSPMLALLRCSRSCATTLLLSARWWAPGAREAPVRAGVERGRGSVAWLGCLKSRSR